jgi:hypothetical protein
MSVTLPRNTPLSLPRIVAYQGNHAAHRAYQAVATKIRAVENRFPIWQHCETTQSFSAFLRSSMLINEIPSLAH